MIIVWFAIKIDSSMAFGAVVGSTTFFITHGFKQNSEQREEILLSGQCTQSDLSKILYPEPIDAAFSIDGVLGAFAFTLSVPLILIGNGLGAIILTTDDRGASSRELTLMFISRMGPCTPHISLGIIMLLDSFGFHVPSRVSPIVTFLAIPAISLLNR